MPMAMGTAPVVASNSSVARTAMRQPFAHAGCNDPDRRQTTSLFMLECDRKPEKTFSDIDWCGPDGEADQLDIIVR